ncbi:hypothetical protein BsWGS_07234 [Bradybaena similaris]
MIRKIVYKTIFMVLACLILSGACINVHVVAARRQGRVDCTRYVFAPVCRGVAAKRNGLLTSNSDEVMSLPQYLDDFVLKSFISSVREQNFGGRENNLDNLRYILKQTLPIENLRQERAIFQEQRDQPSSILPSLLVKIQRSARSTTH